MKCTVRFSIHVTRNKRIVATIKATTRYAPVSRPLARPAYMLGERSPVPCGPVVYATLCTAPRSLPVLYWRFRFEMYC